MFRGTGKAAWSETGPVDPMGHSHYGTAPIMSSASSLSVREESSEEATEHQDIIYKMYL